MASGGREPPGYDDVTTTRPHKCGHDERRKSQQMRWTERFTRMLAHLQRRVRASFRVKTAGPDEISFVFLRDQKPLSDEDWKIACHAREAVLAAVRERAGYIERHGLDPEIHLPRGIWQYHDSHPLYDGYRRIADGDYTAINNLRLFTQLFTGYRLASMEPAEGRPYPTEAPADLDRALEPLATRPDLFVNRYLQITSQLPPELRITPPAMFGELGWRVDGKIVNHDTFVYLERIVLLYEHGVLARLRRGGLPPFISGGRGGYEGLETLNPPQPPLGKGGSDFGPRNAARPVRILEIGGGFGGLAHHLKTLLPDAEYWIVDIPESLVYSAIYLSVLHKESCNVCLQGDEDLLDALDPSPGFRFVPNFLFDSLVETGAGFDLVINTLSLSEMTEKQVRHYCRGIATLLADGGVFFEQNQDNRTVGGLDAQRLIGGCFSSKVELGSRILRRLTQGRAHLWSGAAPVPVRRPVPSVDDEPAVLGLAAT